LPDSRKTGSRGRGWERRTARWGRTDEGARALAKGLRRGYDEPWVWFESGLAAATLGDGPLLDKAREVLKEKDAELARKLDGRVRELAASTAATDHCLAPAPTEPARKEEVPSC
jgi:hypothetical protein